MNIQLGAIIDINNVSLWYHVLQNGQTTLKSYIISSLKQKKHSKPKHQYQLQDITLKVFEGEQIGVVGKNGAGKSTFLKLIAGVLEPDIGSIKVFGAITPLIDLGTGMNNELTVVENIELSGAFLGWKPPETRLRIDSILNWAELKEYGDKPLNMLSTGMQTRLSFAIATSQQPHIVLIDEVLSVGDVHFQDKSTRRLQNLKAAGSACLIVSHDLIYLEENTQRTIWLEEGRVVMDAGTPEVLDEYRKSFG